ncbi:MAG: cupin domain-containing protein [Thermoplasmata archaeon]
MSEPALVGSPLLHRSVGTRGNDFIVHENRDEAPGPGAPRRGVPLHVHRTEDEAWYILEGTLRFRCGEREFDVAPGSGVLLPRGTPHTFWNPGPGATRYLLIVGPQTEGLLEVLHGPSPPGPSDLRDLYASFGVDLLD